MAVHMHALGKGTIGIKGLLKTFMVGVRLQ